MKIDPILSLAVTMHTSKGVYALLLGSGISGAAGIPTGWGVVLDLVRRVAKASGEDGGPDPVEWFRTKHGEEPSYSKLLDQLAPTPALRQQLLRSYFEPTKEERERGLKQPTKAHKAIAKLVVNGFIRIIITTNFDRLLERAIEEEGITPVVVSSLDGLAGSAPFAHQQCTIIKLHGDYLDTRIKNTPEELETYEPAMNDMLGRVFDEYGLIIAGWSGVYDTALCAAIERCPTRRYGFFWASRGDASDQEKRLLAARRGSSIRISDADTFFDDLAVKLEVLDDVSAEHPMQAATAVAMVKRYSARQEDRIRLHDLLMRETEIAFSESSQFANTWRAISDLPSREKYFAALDGSLSKLRRMLGYAAHWGGEGITSVLLKSISRLSQNPMPSHGGEMRDDWLRAYLGGSVMLAAGVGFITSGNYLGAARILTEAYTNGHRDRTKFTDYFRNYIGEINDVMNMYTDRKPYVPFSDSMIVHIRSELNELAASNADIEDAYDEYELLVAFIYGDISNIEPATGSQYINWLTLGRFVHKLQHLGMRSGLYPPAMSEDSIALCKAQKPFADLISAGYFGGSWDRVLELRSMLRDMARHVRYLR